MAQPAPKGTTPAVEGNRAQTPLERAIDQYLVHLRVERGSSENTIASYARDLRRYAAYLSTLGVIDPERITTAQVRSFMRELAAPTVPLPGLATPAKKQPEEESSVDAEEAAESLAVLIAAEGVAPPRESGGAARGMSRCRWALTPSPALWQLCAEPTPSGSLPL